MPAVTYQEEKSLRLIIVEDEGLSRESLRVALDTFSELSVVGTFSDLASAARDMEERRPDVVIVSFPAVASPTEAEEYVGFFSRFPKLAVVLLVHGEGTLPTSVLEAFRRNSLAGRCCLARERITHLSALRRAIHACADGLVIFDADFLAPKTHRPDFPTPPHDFQRRFSRRQWEVLELVAKGFTNDFIATKLFLSLRTVQNHVSHIYQLLPELLPEPVLEHPVYHPRVAMTLLYLDHLSATDRPNHGVLFGDPGSLTANQVALPRDKRETGWCDVPVV